MGISSSKIAQKVPENAILDEQPQQGPRNPKEDQESVPSTPILTPKTIRENIEKETLDPRSPSKHIARTPIELIPTAAVKLKSLITFKSAKNEVPMETPLKSHKILGIDPRSPALEFQRTPIVVSASPDKNFPEKIRNKNLDKVLKCALPFTPKGKITPPRLLESCPITPKPKTDAYKRKSFVLLETNVDFTETDLDNVIKEKSLGKSLQDLYVPGESVYSEINDPRSPSTAFIRTPIQICQKVEDPDKNIQTIESPSVQKENKNVALKEVNNLPNEQVTVITETVSSISIQPETILLANKEDIVEVEDNSVKKEDCDVENAECLVENEEYLFEKGEFLVEKEECCVENEECLVENEECLVENEECLVENEECLVKKVECLVEIENDVVESILVVEVNDQNSTESKLQERDQLDVDKELPMSVYMMVKEPLLDTCVTETEEVITVTPSKKSLATTAEKKCVFSPILKYQPQFSKSASMSPPSVVSVTPKKSKSQPVTPPLIDLTADVKELDKKLTHLIYEDEKDLVVCPRIVKMKDQNRTPLKLRNGTENKRSTQKLKVSDKPRKAEYAVSKIPVFKEKKIKVQCENTPPRGMRSKKSQWDAKDDTLVI